MSEILLATDHNQQTVVLKIACVQQRSRTEINRRAIHNSVAWLQRLAAHPGIAQLQPIQRTGQAGQRSKSPPTYVATLPDWPDQPDFLITEYLPGGTLSRFVGKQPLPLELALGLTCALARTLAYLHSCGCVHRDLKPENILFRQVPKRGAPVAELQPALIDFGIAAPVGEPKLISGSRLWMAPELQLAYEKSPLPVDPSWDVYALGLISCYMLSGLRPQRRQHNHQDYVDYQEQVFASLRHTQPETDSVRLAVLTGLEQALARALAFNPQERPTAAELASTLTGLLAQLGLSLPAEDSERTGWLSLATHRLAQLPRLKYFTSLIVVGLLLLLLTRLWANSPVAEQGTGATVQSAAVPVLALPVRAAPTATVQEAMQPVRSAASTEAPATLARPTLPPPTLAALPTRPPAIPTLAVVRVTPLTTPPTLAPLPPTPSSTQTPSTLRVVQDRLPTATALGLPAGPTVTAGATPRRQPTSGTTGTIRLRAPAGNSISAQERVEFVWESHASLAAEQCYELVFWDPAQGQDQRSPSGAGRATRATVNMRKLLDSPDPLLRTLARSKSGFDWGVRLVNCADPQTVVQAVTEVRHFIYRP